MSDLNWKKICTTQDLVIDSGVCALVDHNQIAIFHVSNDEKGVYAISNYDPIGKANVLYRGIVGDVKGELVVASPLYKQHFSLTTGVCLEDENETVTTYAARINGDDVELAV